MLALLCQILLHHLDKLTPPAMQLVRSSYVSVALTEVVNADIVNADIVKAHILSAVVYTQRSAVHMDAIEHRCVQQASQISLGTHSA